MKRASDSKSPSPRPPLTYPLSSPTCSISDVNISTPYDSVSQSEDNGTSTFEHVGDSCFECTSLDNFSSISTSFNKNNTEVIVSTALLARIEYL